MKVGVVRFPGTNCDRDVWQALTLSGHQPKWLWHQDRFAANEVQAVVVPGGFSYGDYLRSGALAARSPVMDSIRDADKHGTPILGICNGFQILCEADLLPGVLVRNASQRFIDKWLELRIETSNSHWAPTLKTGLKIRLPIAHGDGRYFAPAEDLRKIWDNGSVWLTYVENPNGSLKNIAGVKNKKGNVSALMPHPERAVQSWMGGQDGIKFFEDLK